ncbi:hypothetical protein ACJMK2_040972 [Sinanodonta woodiana]|uniref:TIR domain-containing protein n=1 Tax=Sinanodonta woodiana TaxID=1069815 RepID=A0ABD3W403_SINWO
MKLKVLHFLALYCVNCIALLIALLWLLDQNNDNYLSLTWLTILLYICFTHLTLYKPTSGKGIFRKIANIVIYTCVSWQSVYTYIKLYSISSPDSWRLVQPDNVYPFIRFDHIYECLLDEGGSFLKIVTVFMVKALKRFNILNILLYVIYLCFHAVIFVFILDSLFIYAYKLAECNVFNENNFIINIDAFGYEANTRPLHYFELEHGSDAFSWDMCKVNYKQTMYNNKTLKWQITQYDVTLDPFIQETVTRKTSHYDRQIGDDLSLNCKFNYYYFRYLAAEKCEHFWMKNGQMVTNSDRHRSNINTKLKSSWTGSEYISVAMKLDIQILQKNDMGMYHCVLKCLHKYQLMGHTSYSLQTEYVINSYFVKELQPLTTYRRVPVGIMVYISSIVYSSATDHVTFEYLINHKTIDELGPELSCSLFVRLYFLFNSKELIKERIPYFALERLDNFHLMSGIFCNHGSHYGSHRLILWRNFFNITKRKWELIEIPHYKTVVLLPDHTKSILPFHNNSNVYDEIVEKIESGIIRDEIDTYILKIIKYNEDNNFLIVTWIVLSISLLIILVVAVVLHKISCLYFHWTVKKASLFILEGRMFPAICDEKTLADLDDQKKPHEFDYFISNAEVDRSLVHETLVPLLEQKYRAKVCLIDRDLPQGRTLLNALQWGISRSRRIIVVLSPSYIEDNFCNKMQLEHLILPDLYEGNRGPTDVLLLMIQQCKIPQAIRWNLDIEHIDWTSDASDRTKWDRLERWASM